MPWVERHWRSRPRYRRRYYYGTPDWAIVLLVLFLFLLAGTCFAGWNVPVIGVILHAICDLIRAFFVWLGSLA